jgi:hypothetical protein
VTSSAAPDPSQQPEPFTLGQLTQPLHRPVHQPPAARPPRRRRPVLIAAVAVAVLVAAAVLITLALTNRGSAPAADVPKIANIARPNVACTPAADRKIGLGEDISGILWVGWMDGKQTEMPLGQAMAQRIAGHTVEDAWYCPPRSQW